MADLKISALTASTTPLAGTEVLPIVQSSTTVKVAVSDLTAGRAVSTAALTATGLITAPKGASNGITVGDVTTNSNSVLRLQGTSAGYNWQIANNLNSGGIEFTQSTATGGTTYTTPKFEMLNTGNFNIAAGNAVFSTAAKGVNFTANTPKAGMTSQLLNWYEQGTFTPTLSGSGGDPTSTYTAQVGYYTRVGNLVTIYIQLFTSSYSGGAGTLQIKGLPWAATNGARFNINTVRITFGATAVQVCAAVDGGSTTMYFDESNSALADSTLNLSAWNSGASAGMTVFGSYTI